MGENETLRVLFQAHCIYAIRIAMMTGVEVDTDDD